MANRILQLALALSLFAAAAFGASAPSITDQRARELVLVAADLYENAYVEPEKARRISEELRKRVESGRYDGTGTVSTLADRLTADLQEIGHDKHLGARYDPQLSAGDPHAGATRRRVVEAPPGVAGGEGPIRVVRSAGPRDPARAEKDRRSNYGFHRLERLDGNVGYLEMREIAPIGMINGAAGAGATGARDTAAAAMAFLASSDAIIIDLRQCPGGSADTVSFLASYFFGPERRELFTRYDRPLNETRVEYTVEDLPGRRLPDTDLWILVGPGTASAGESLAYLLQQFGRATVVGETTAGAGYNVAIMPVGDGLVVGVSVAKPMHPKTGRGWEGDGVKPDVSIAAADALTTAHASALRKLLAKESEGPRRKELDWALDRVAPTGKRKVAAAELAALKGRYGERTVTLEDGHLVCRAANGRARTMDPVGKDSFTWDDQTRASFTKDSAGRPAELVLERTDGTVERFPRQTEISGKETR